MILFDRITGRLHLRFKNRKSAGIIISEALKDVTSKDESKNSIVLRIPRGGVITADTISRRLNCDLDLIIPRSLVRHITEILLSIKCYVAVAKIDT